MARGKSKLEVWAVQLTGSTPLSAGVYLRLLVDAQGDRYTDLRYFGDKGKGRFETRYGIILDQAQTRLLERALAEMKTKKTQAPCLDEPTPEAV